jgi:ribosome maturation factor RimP
VKDRRAVCFSHPGGKTPAGGLKGHFFFNGVFMIQNPLTDKIAVLAEPLLASLGLALWGVEFVGAARSLLRLYIEGAGNAAAPGIDECAKASRLIGLSLDVEDLVPGPYVLEVSTPGLDRLFFTPAQLAAYAGQPLELSLTVPSFLHAGRRNFLGRITRAVEKEEDWRFTLESLEPLRHAPEDLPPLKFGWAEVKKARLLYIEPEKPGKTTGNKK